MFTATEIVTASARSGWAPGIDLQVVAAAPEGMFAIGDGFGPTYGGHHYPVSLEPALNAMRQALRSEEAVSLRSAIASAQRVAYNLQFGRAGTPVNPSHTGVGITLAVLRERDLHVA